MPVPRYAVFGHPVAHSLSPRIHAAFAKATGVSLEYTAIDAAPETFEQDLARFVAEGGRGANVTVPHKEQALALCATLTPRAQRAGAVNTLVWEGSDWLGDNTDGAGLVRDLTSRHGLDLRGRRVLLLGAGGAARGVAPALLDAGVRELVIVNRSPARADALADALGEPARAHSRYWEDLAVLGDFELILNATSAGRSEPAPPDLPRGLVSDMTDAVDLNYGNAAIPFLAWANAMGCRRRLDGLGMLVEQAAESFELWHGVRPQTDAILAELHAATLAADAGD